MTTLAALLLSPLGVVLPPLLAVMCAADWYVGRRS